MDRLASARTLAAIVDRVERAMGKGNAAPTQKSLLPQPPPSPLEPVAGSVSRNGKAHGNGNGNGKTKDKVRRLMLEVVDAPLEGSESGLMPGGTVLITQDDRGIAQALAAAIIARGWRVAMIGGPSSRLDWTSSAAVDSAIRDARSEEPIAGLAHLLPMRSARNPELDSTAWASRMSPEVQGLFLLAKGLADDLDRAARRGGACLIAATAMGGRFASTGRADADFFPGQGAIAGLVKTIAREWTSVRTRAIDLRRERRYAPIGRTASCRDSPRRCLDRGWLRGLAPDQASGDPGVPGWRGWPGWSDSWPGTACAHHRRCARHHIAGRRRTGAAVAAQSLADRYHAGPRRPRRRRARWTCQLGRAQGRSLRAATTRGTVRVAHGSRKGVSGAQAIERGSPQSGSCCVPRARASSMPRSMSAIPPASPPS